MSFSQKKYCWNGWGKLAGLLPFLFSAVLAFGQRPTCGQELRWQQDLAGRPQLQQRADSLRALVQMNLGGLQSRNELVIPVVVHIVWSEEEENIPDELVHSQLEVLNRLFAPLISNNSAVPEEFRHLAARTGIRFCLAERQTPEGTETGIVRRQTDLPDIGLQDALFHTSLGGSSAWDTRHYLNIWVAPLGTGLTGFGTSPEQATLDRDGAVIHPRFFGKNGHPNYGLGKVAVHEIGHYFGLLHPWGTCGGEGDGVDDTPEQEHFYSGCPAYPQHSCGSSDQFMNYMDYVDDGCMSLFTQGQADWMLATLHTLRPGLLENSLACAEPALPGGFFSFSIYPNPVSDELVVVVSQLKKDKLTGKILNGTGQLVRRVEIGSRPETTVPVDDLPAGLYFLEISGETEKFVVIR